MSLFNKWQDLINNQTEASFPKFWELYSTTETKIYSAMLAAPEEKVSGTFKALYEKYEADPVIYMGFLDGIQSSLNNSFDLDAIGDDSEISLDIDLEKLFYNMMVAEADYLYSLPEWDAILSEEKKKEIVDAFRKSRTVVKEKEPGRNDPCSCGSGKKYKKCCGANK